MDKSPLPTAALTGSSVAIRLSTRALHVWCSTIVPRPGLCLSDRGAVVARTSLAEHRGGWVDRWTCRCCVRVSICGGVSRRHDPADLVMSRRCGSRMVTRRRQSVPPYGSPHWRWLSIRPTASLNRTLCPGAAPFGQQLIARHMAEAVVDVLNPSRSMNSTAKAKSAAASRRPDIGSGDRRRTRAREAW